MLGLLEIVDYRTLSIYSVTDNEITLMSELEQDRLCRLHTLELRGNRLTSVSELCLPSLKNLYLVSLPLSKTDRNR